MRRRDVHLRLDGSTQMHPLEQSLFPDVGINTMTEPSTSRSSSPDSGINSGGSTPPSSSDELQDCPSQILARAEVFLRDHLYEEPCLLEKLCKFVHGRQLCDEEKVQKGGPCNFGGTLLKDLIQRGNEMCQKFLKELKGYPLYLQYLNLSQPKLWNDLLDYYGDLLLEEMEPTLITKILVKDGIFSGSESDEIKSENSRANKCMVVISKVRGQQNKVVAFFHALKDSKCSKFYERIQKGTLFQPCCFSGESTRCVRFNYRKLTDAIESEAKRQTLFDHLRKKIIMHQNRVPKQSHLVKTVVRNDKQGCDCLLQFLQHVHNDLVEDMMKRLEFRKKNGRERVETCITFGKLRAEKDFLLDELEPVRMANILFEEEAFSVEIHDDVEETKGRRSRSEIFIDRLFRERSERTLDAFVFALMENDFKQILDKFRSVQTVPPQNVPQGPQSSRDDRDSYDDMHIELVGMEGSISEDMVLPADMRMTISIPVEGEMEQIQQAMEHIRNNQDLHVQVAEKTYMKIEGAEIGSIVVTLTPLTDDAGTRLFDKKGHRVTEMIEKLLTSAGIKKKMIDGKIKVTISAAGKNMQDKYSIIKEKITQHWSYLLDELEPCQLLSMFRSKNHFSEDEAEAILQESRRGSRVGSLLKILLEKENNVIDFFIETLKQTGKDDIAEKIEAVFSKKEHEDAEKIRKGLLYNFKDVIDEIESSIIDETLKMCEINMQKEFKSKLGNLRKEKAYNFLVTVMQNDGHVLALKDVLTNRGLEYCFEMPENTEDFQVKREFQGTVGADKKGILFECHYTIKNTEEEVMEKKQLEFEPSEKCKIQKPSPVPEKRADRPIKEPKRKPHPEVRKKKALEPIRRPQVPHRGKVFGRPCPEKGEKGREWSVVVALDFGTTYSGFAFWSKENPSDITPGKWKTNSAEVLESLKTPTSILLNKENQLIAFGFEAERIFKELVEDEEDDDYRFFCKFKMILHRKQSLDANMEMVLDHLGHPMKAIEVFSIAIKYLKDECVELLTNKNMMVADDEIRWILTVPAIWDEFSKQFMRKAAEMAEIPSDQLKLALEPEAAAIYVIKESKAVLGKESLTNYAPGAQIMLADLGGGTADFTVLELLEDGKMKQLYRAIGGAWGGNMINQKVWEMLENIFGRDVIKEFKKQTADYMEMESNIELKKRDLTTGSKLALTMFPSFAEICKNLKGKNYKELVLLSDYSDIVKVRTGKLVFGPEMVEQIFDMTLSHLFVTVEKILKNPNTHGVKDIILVGGFSQSEIIVKQFEKRFRRYKVIIPTDPGLAVLKGAVMFGEDIDIIKSRISPHTYGFDGMRYFVQGDPQNKRKTIEGTPYCIDLFEEMVRIGESVDVGKTVEKEVFAASAEMTKMVLKFYQSNEENPQFVTDKGCECIGRLFVDMPVLSGGTERSVSVSIKFGETEIMVCGVDKTTGRRQETKLDLLGKNY